MIDSAFDHFPTSPQIGADLQMAESTWRAPQHGCRDTRWMQSLLSLAMGAEATQDKHIQLTDNMHCCLHEWKLLATNLTQCPTELAEIVPLP